MDLSLSVLHIIIIIFHTLKIFLEIIYENSIRDAHTPQSGEMVLDTTRYRRDQKVNSFKENCKL